MNQITIDNILLVEVPEDATKMNVIGQKLIFFEGDHPIYDLIELIPGNWQFIGTTDEISEAICEKIFDKPTEKTRYEIGGEDFITATAAWNYLRRVNRVPSDKRFAILKQAA